MPRSPEMPRVFLVVSDMPGHAGEAHAAFLSTPSASNIESA